MNIPKPVTVGPGDQQQVYPTIDKFFDDVHEYLTVKLKLRRGMHPYFEKDERMMWIDEDVGAHEKIKYLKFHDQVIALAIETRTSFNDIRFDYLTNFNDLEEIVEQYGD
jgi:hypothetical protein